MTTFAFRNNETKSNNKNTKQMKTYLVNYNFPVQYRGSYLVNAVDGFEAGRKITAYLKETYGPTDSSNSEIIEIVGGTIQIIGK